ncbi:MAG: CheR family methyltransferase [Gammaproteobacteria bacterium]
MPFPSIKKLLHQKIGLNASSVGDSSIERAIKHRIEANKLSDVKSYYELLLANSNELAELVEEVVVPETWFFRNNTPFDAFQEYVTKTIVPKLEVSEKIRILSIPCSTGEEPYSAAICLHRAGIALDRIAIDAVDISKRALTKARRAIYGRNSFRGVDEGLQDRYFKNGGAGYRLIEEIREIVNFKQGNFLIGPLSAEANYYDAIFCRNLLIYFDRETQKQALDKLHRALKERGALFVGHAETSQVAKDLFVQLYSARSFGYVKVSESNRRKTKRALQMPQNIPDQWESVFNQLAKLTSTKAQTGRAKSENRTKSTKPTKAEKTEAFVPKVSLRSVERLANQGKYSDAIELCMIYLKQNPESADGYYMLALVKDLNGESVEAGSLLRKAIYLNPNHEQALVMAALLAEKNGDIEAALSYKRRAKRVAQRKPGQSSVA